MASNEWELSKENVIPLRQGRNFNALLQSQSDDEIIRRRIKEEQHAFEAELRMYKGNDPLDVWDRYIKWTEQNFPKGGQQNHLNTILERCAKLFKDDEQYANDPRYLTVWLKFIPFCSDTLEIYNFMQTNGIGTRLAEFYDAWASTLESMGSLKKAEAIYNQGIQCDAQPLQHLIHRHKEFQLRVQRLQEQEQASSEAQGGTFFPETAEEERTTLGDLRGVGRRKRAPVSRVGDAKLGIQGGLRSAAQHHHQAAPSQSFSIHVDRENAPPSMDASASASEWNRLPSQADRKENHITPSQWNKAKMPKKNVPHIPIQEISKTIPPSFPVHEDALMQPSVAATPRRVSAVENVLSAKKAVKPESFLKSNPVSGDTSKPCRDLPMYCKCKIYSGAEEFSFEEIRALRLQEKQQLKETVAAEYAKSQAQMQLQIQELQRQLQQQQSNSSGSSTSEKSLPTPESASQRSSDRSLNCSQANRSNSTLSAPSPTVNTKLALGEVRAWYCDSSAVAEFEEDFKNISVGHSVEKQELQSSTSSKPFAIFDENAIDKENAVGPPSKRPGLALKPAEPTMMTPTPTSAPFAVFEDPAPVVKPKSCGLKLRSAPSVSSTPEDPMDAVDENAFELPMETQHEICSGSGFNNFQEANFEDDATDFTFAPKISSTCNIAKLGLGPLGTPFKPEVTEFKAEESSSVPPPPPSKCMSAPPTEPRQNESNGSISNPNITRRRSSIAPAAKTLKLSPIEEKSDESSYGSSNCQSTIAGSTFGHTTTHTSNFTIPTAPPAYQLMNKTCHEIEISPNTGPADPQLNMSIAIETQNPFDEKIIKRILGKLKNPINECQNYHSIDEPLPTFKGNTMVKFGKESYQLLSKVGEGGYASVYACELMTEDEDSMDMDSHEMVVKVQKPASYWEFYICEEVIKRASELSPPLGMTDVTMAVNEGYFFKDGSCLINHRHEYGTLIDLVNACSRLMQGQLPVPIVAYIGVELLLILEMLHKCSIIHGDLKPDNFLVMRFPRLEPNQKLKHLLNGEQKMLKLIDFGRSIDMKQFPEGTTFTATVDTSGFQCVEMKAGRPWTYQADLFGVVGTLHVLLFGKYMTCRMVNGLMKPNSTFKRFWPGVESWQKMFEDFLNVPSCDQLPVISDYRHALENIVCASDLSNFNDIMNELEKALVRL